VHRECRCHDFASEKLAILIDRSLFEEVFIGRVNISRNEKYAFETPKTYCVDCDPKREVQVFAAMHERRL